MLPNNGTFMDEDMCTHRYSRYNCINTGLLRSLSDLLKQDLYGEGVHSYFISSIRGKHYGADTYTDPLIHRKHSLAHSQPTSGKKGRNERNIYQEIFFFLLLNTELTCYILRGVSMRFRLPLVFYANQQSSGTLMKQTTCIYNSLLLFSQSLAALLTQLIDCMHFPPHGELLNPQGTIALKSLENPSFNHSIRIKPRLTHVCSCTDTHIHTQYKELKIC